MPHQKSPPSHRPLSLSTLCSPSKKFAISHLYSLKLSPWGSTLASQKMRFLLLFILQISQVPGHGDLHEQIIKISAQITKAPDNPKLWLSRADLHQSHRNPKAARHDLLEATLIQPPFALAFLKLAQFERKRGEIPLAQVALAKHFALVTDPTPQAHREKALLSAPAEALEPWQHFLKNKAEPSMHDFTLAAQAAFEAEDQKATRAFLKSGLNRHPKSIQLHQINARTFLAEKDAKSAEQSFGILKLLYPNLLVKLNYEESLIWEKYEHPTHAHQALLSALKASHRLPARLQKNRDLQNLVAKIKATLRK
jgi:predicted Zn-dependent protease